MLPTEWGPIIWYNFHMMSYTYNEEMRENYIKFFKSMAYILPCNTCSEHFKKNLSKATPEENTVNRNIMIKWLNDMHNSVNIRLNKKIVSLQMANKIYYRGDNLVVNHDKILSFVKITKGYLRSGISSIVLYHGSNVIINYCYFCPCIKCRTQLIELVNNSGNKRDLKKLVDKMMDIISDCNSLEKLINKSTYLNLNTFLPNQRIYKIMVDKKLKVIIKQNGSTPGVKKRVIFGKKEKCVINVDITYGRKMKPFLWFKEGNKITKVDKLKNVEYVGDGIVEVGVFMEESKINDIFYLNKFCIDKV